VQKDLDAVGLVEQFPRLEGRQMVMVLAPKKKGAPPAKAEKPKQDATKTDATRTEASKKEAPKMAPKVAAKPARA
jgi:translation initiation factor IF-3